ncbi:FYVE and coiled-coil domain-containing protein 1 [Conger conger]|uniref:FYVE and coiled-coil domain-containing protein 1 n=1 Tax=Conger conger TaxID=82655 RepID=UPI002A5A9ADC|nr:FYVE and coiled-coil domain-containing protein 1 [Conger conger]XP_061095332.1 FYVE and coiled-coil domain-containing protein 1 [Conger conger]
MAAGESQLQRIIRDLQEAVAELTREYQESGEPITDDSPSLHKFSYKLEYLLQFDQKEKTTFLGARKDYWDYFSDCLAKIKGANDGIRFVKSIPELKTSLGKGRAFLRYSLVHQRLADTLQQCLINQRVTSDWYFARSPLLKPHLSVDIISHLYELNEVQFDVASRGHDLDSAWPTFARRTLGSGSPGHLWKPPSRSSSINSLASSFSQQAQDFLCSPDFGLLDESGEQGCEPAGANVSGVSVSAQEALRLELDQAELRHRELLARVRQAGEEGAELRQVLGELQAQLDASLAAHEALRQDSAHQRRRLEQEAEALKAESRAREAESRQLRAQLEGAEQRSAELLSRLQGELSEKGQQAASHFDSAQKMHELLAQLQEAQMGAEEQREEVRRAESALRESEARLEELCASLSQREVELQEARSSLEARERQATEEKEALESRARGLEEEVGAREEQAKKVEEYREQCASLMELNGGLLQTARRQEEATLDLRAAGAERERRLEQENRELREEQAAVKEALASMQAELRSIRAQISELEGSLATSRRREEDLQKEKVELEKERVEREKEKVVWEKETVEREKEKVDREKEREEWEKEREELQKEKAELQKEKVEWEKEREELQKEKVEWEKEREELQKEKVEWEKERAEWEKEREELQKEVCEAGVRLSGAEAQLELHLGEVSRLQEEVQGLRTGLCRAEEEEARARSRLEATKEEKEELRSLRESLKAQLEQMNRGHVQELQSSREEVQALRAELQSSREEAQALKRQQEALSVELDDAREGLHRANTETAELGVALCGLTARSQEAQGELGEARRQLQEAQGEARDLRGRLEQAEGRGRSLQESHREEADAVRFQMSSEAMSYQNQIKSANQEVVAVRAQLTAEQEKGRHLEARLSELETVNRKNSQLVEEKDSGISERDAVIGQKDEELQSLRESLASAGADLLMALGRCEELKGELEVTVADRENHKLKMAAEMDDLCRTKGNLEERLIELIRDKDALWQKSDALEFEQKLRAEEQWWLVDKEATHCLSCRSQFTWLLRRHHCRLCGRIFCYYCSNNFVMTKQSGRKERCCRDCYSQHSAVRERLTQAELGLTPPPAGTAPGPAPYTPTPSVTVTDPGSRSEDAVFDIITEEEVNGVYDSDSLSHGTEDSPERETGTSTELGSSGSRADPSPEGPSPEDSEEQIPAVQDAEIHLLKSGELASSVPLAVEDMAQFGDGSRELLIKASSYSVITMELPKAGPTISWLFSSEPKSVSFSVVFREGPLSPLEQAKVLIPLTRCDSHRETIQGQLKARNPGTYLLIFDNSFSRFISKKVLYHLTIEKPIIYDGSDCL